MPRGNKSQTAASNPSRAQEESDVTAAHPKKVPKRNPDHTTLRRSSRLRASPSATEPDQGAYKKTKQSTEGSSAFQQNRNSKPVKGKTLRAGGSVQSERKFDYLRQETPDYPTKPKNRNRQKHNYLEDSKRPQQIKAGPLFKRDSALTKSPVQQTSKAKSNPRLRPAQTVSSGTKKFLKLPNESHPNLQGIVEAHSGGTEQTLEVQDEHLQIGPSNRLTEENFDEFSRRLKVQTATLPIPISTYLAENFSNIRNEGQSSEIGSLDPEEAFNRRWGYLPPLSEETSKIVAAIVANPGLAETMARITAGSSKFKSGLENRNVNNDPSEGTDPRADEINSMNLENFWQETEPQRQCHEELWKSDRAQCTLSSNEALFQRTLMIGLIARHFLIYRQIAGQEQMLQFSAEEPWSCPPMPTKAVWQVPYHQAFDHQFLTQPQPDLAVCFKREAIMPINIWKRLPDPTKALACFENMDSSASKIFHFFTIEAKSAKTDVNAKQALQQSLNNASQALHNMFEFFRDAGHLHKRIFFEKVRFFSAVATRNGIIVRIHRAVEIPQDADKAELVMPDTPQYRLKFEYNEFAKFNGEDVLDRGRILEVFKKIFKYAVEELGVWITKAASDLGKWLWEDFEHYQARRANEFYRYGQPVPILTKSRRESANPSQSGLATSMPPPSKSAKSRSNYQTPLPDQSMTSSVTTPRQIAPQPTASTSKYDSQKRRQAEVEANTEGLGELQMEESRQPTRNKRRRKSSGAPRSGMSERSNSDISVNA